jgi:hypothetical protein
VCVGLPVVTNVSTGKGAFVVVAFSLELISYNKHAASPSIQVSDRGVRHDSSKGTEGSFTLASSDPRFIQGQRRPEARAIISNTVD